MPSEPLAVDQPVRLRVAADERRRDQRQHGREEQAGRDVAAGLAAQLAAVDPLAHGLQVRADDGEALLRLGQERVEDDLEWSPSTRANSAGEYGASEPRSPAKRGR